MSRSRAGTRWAGWLLLAIIAVGTARAFAATSASSQAASPRCCRVSAASALTTSGPLLAGYWWQKYYNQFESSLASRQGMLRFGAVGMLLALFVIWYRK